MTATMMKGYMEAQTKEIVTELMERGITPTSERFQAEVVQWIAENGRLYREAWEEIETTGE